MEELKYFSREVIVDFPFSDKFEIVGEVDLQQAIKKVRRERLKQKEQELWESFCAKELSQPSKQKTKQEKGTDCLDLQLASKKSMLHEKPLVKHNLPSISWQSIDDLLLLQNEYDFLLDAEKCDNMVSSEPVIIPQITSKEGYLYSEDLQHNNLASSNTNLSHKSKAKSALGFSHITLISSKSPDTGSPRQDEEINGKLDSVRSKIIQNLENICSQVHNIVMPEDAAELLIAQRKADEFCSRFSRNYLYQIGHQLNIVTKALNYCLPPRRWKPHTVNSQRIVSLHQIILQAYSLQDDLENFMMGRLMGSNMRLKKGVLPHKFECQKAKKTVDRKTGEIRKRKMLVMELLREASLNATNSEASTSVDVDASASVDVDASASVDVDAVEQSTHLTSAPLDKAVQVNMVPTYRSKATNTLNVRPPTTHSSCSPIKGKPVESPLEKLNVEAVYSSSSSDPEDSDSDLFVDYGSGSDFEDNNMEMDALNVEMKRGYILLVQRQPQLYLGIPKEMYHVLAILQDTVCAPIIDIMICLKKIRLNFSYKVIGAHFGMSDSSICRIFKKTIPILSGVLKELIIWPSAKLVRLELPIAFRARYRNVRSIIDCLEIQIEKPGNSLHQSLTWSEYKACNTVKYLISCTPDGLINFLSCGYGGRATDSTIAQDCGYFDNIATGTWVMADRGFKNISHILEEKGAHLVRPPSVLQKSTLSQNEVKEAKRIAALRIHVERVISRVREFHMLTMHSTIDHNLVNRLDEIIVIACGLINLQKSLIKV